jgi:hypothetical protein
MLLLTEDIDGNWDPTDLYQSNDEIECIYCKKSDTEFCDVLGQYVDKIYEKIKEHPNVRLDLLYL